MRATHENGGTPCGEVGAQGGKGMHRRELGSQGGWEKVRHPVGLPLSCLEALAGGQRGVPCIG